MIAVLMAQFGSYLFPILGIVAAFFGVYKIGQQKEAAKRDLLQAVREEQHKTEVKAVESQVAAVKEEVKIIEGKTHVQDAINVMPVADVTNRLRDEWQRD